MRVDQLVGEIVRLASAQAADSQIEVALKDNTEFVRKKVGDHEVITTRAISAQEEAIIGSVKAGRFSVQLYDRNSDRARRGPPRWNHGGRRCHSG